MVDVPGVPAPQVPGDAYVLDVREDDEWIAGHVPDAVHIRLGELQHRVAEVPRDRDVYVICRSGVRSYHAAAFLNAGGGRARNVDGGMESWAAAGRRMTSETGGDPYVA